MVVSQGDSLREKRHAIRLRAPERRKRILDTATQVFPLAGSEKLRRNPDRPPVRR